MNKNNILNIFEYSNNYEIWEETKEKFLKQIDEFFELKRFLEKHLKENFKNLIPSAELLNNLPRIVGYSKKNVFQDPDFKFSLIIYFTERDLFSNIENKFSFEIKLKDISTNCSVTNKKELKEIFHKILFRTGVEAGYIHCLIQRYEVEIDIFRNEKDILIINENILNDLPLKTKYETTLQRVKNDIKKNIELHKFENYLKLKYKLKTDAEYIDKLRMKIGKNKIKYDTLEQSLRRYRKGLKNP